MSNESETMNVEELRTMLGRRKGKATILIQLHDGKGRVVEGIIPPNGVSNDTLNVVFLYGVLTDDYQDDFEEEVAVCEVCGKEKPVYALRKTAGDVVESCCRACFDRMAQEEEGE